VLVQVPIPVSHNSEFYLCECNVKHLTLKNYFRPYSIIACSSFDSQLFVDLIFRIKLESVNHRVDDSSDAASVRDGADFGVRNLGFNFSTNSEVGGRRIGLMDDGRDWGRENWEQRRGDA
jgi:hypothetical protein